MASALGFIAGRVLASTGTPVAGATVAIVGGSQPYRDVAAVTTADGRFRLGGLRPGDYRVEARASGAMGSVQAAVPARAGAEVEIRLT
jgi:protocatechuate 3,4-dioxygenase beta subunit